MNDKFLRAIAAGEKAKADGVLTIKEIVWVVSAWLSFLAECGYHLADPTEPVDRAALAAALTQGWVRVADLIDGVPMPWGARLVWQTVRAAIPAMIAPIATELGARLDAGEVHDD